MKISKIAIIGVMAFAAAAAHAGPTSIGSGVGSFEFSGNKDHSFYVDLDAGTYSFSASVESYDTTTLDDVWFSNSKDKKDSGQHDVSFSRVGAQEFDGAVSSVTLTGPTRVYIDVDAAIGANGKGDPGYSGLLTVSAVPEPTTTALLLAGLGMMGFISRRRRNNG